MMSATIGERVTDERIGDGDGEVDRILADIAAAARDSLRESDVDLLRGAIAVDESAWLRLRAGGHRAPMRIAVRAADGTELRDVLRVLLAAIRGGTRIDVSLGWPLSDRLHRALLRAGAQVRVESLRTWGCRVGHGGDRIRVVGPRRSRSTALRRAMPRPEEWASGADATDVDLDGASELERLFRPMDLRVAV
ncbi:hypothetical protein [Microbacterium candidum]|uniref:Uncharacterized protein n=1 Tax=Microbacterium candidum TaxID=3041922 RepID=A0ABT7MU77_9MICO|nr:hypothetical protein [Microbacterium sp. ASV49]MDL9978001.1 hypothetical protein [Microbacterium sp. ASV49]